MSYPHWDYFFAIERELWETTRYVELSQQNYSTYSIEFAKILMTSCAEIDSVAKLICTYLAENNLLPTGSHSIPKRPSINDYYQIIVPKYPLFKQVEIEITQYSLNLKPWENWQK